MKNYLVLWSGGLDSTYLIYQLLARGHNVTTASVLIDNNQYHTKREATAIRKLSKLFSAQWPRQFTPTDPSHVNITGDGSLLSLKQPILFLNHAIYHISPHTNHVAIAYVMNDDAISFLNEINTIWKSYANFIFPAYTLPTLKFPLSKTSKEFIWYALPQQYKSLTQWCESPDNISSPCQSCHSCKRMQHIIST